MGLHHSRMSFSTTWLDNAGRHVKKEHVPFALILTQDSKRSESWTWCATVLMVVVLLMPLPFDVAQASSWDQPEIVADEDDRDRDRDNDPPPALTLPGLAAVVPLPSPSHYREPLSSSSFVVCTSAVREHLPWPSSDSLIATLRFRLVIPSTSR